MNESTFVKHSTGENILICWIGFPGRKSNSSGNPLQCSGNSCCS